MRKLIFSFVGLTISILGIGVASAQHVHRHGNHFDIHQNVPHGHDSAGHLTDSFGHHIDGHGRHTGAIGVFEDGSHGGPWQGHIPSFGYFPSYGYHSLYSSYYSSPSLSLQIYGRPYGSGSYYNAPNYNTQSIPTILGNSSLIIPYPQAVAPRANIVANRIPLTDAGAKANLLPQVGQEIRLRNPRESGGSINYSLNEFTYTINPGEAQTIQADRQWVLQFDNGLGKTVAVRLAAGTSYDFKVSQQSGWSVASTGTTAPTAANQPK